VGSGTAVTLAVTLPTGIEAGDQVVLATTQPSTDTVTAPTAYTKVTSVTSSGTTPLASTTVFRHTVVAGDTSVTLTYSTKATAHAVVLAVYRGVDPNLPIDVTATASAAAGTSVVAPSVTPAYPYDQLLVFQGAVGTFSKETWSAPAGTTETVQRNSTANVSSGLAGETLGTIAATGTEASAFGASANLTTVAVAIAQPPSVLFLHHDQLGSTRLLTDSAGVVRATFTYNPYGMVTASTGYSTTAFLFSGQYRDAATGFYYLRARYYDPATGQFLTVDPKVATTLSPYGYVQGNPLNSSDPTGLDNCGLFAFFCDAVSTAAQHVAGAVGTLCLRNPLGGNNNNGGCGTTLSTSQGVTAIGITLGEASAVTGVGALVDAEALGGSAVLGGLSVGSGLGAGALDLPGCLQGNKAACVGAFLGLAGASAGAPELLGGLFGLGEESMLAAVFGGLSAFGVSVGIAGSIFSLISDLAACGTG